MEEDSLQTKPFGSHPWKTRFIIGLLIILISFVGLVVSSFSQNAAWDYWRIAAIVFAVLSLFLSWYVKKASHLFTWKKLFQELLHWVALLLGVFLFSLFVDAGMMGKFEAGISILTILAITLFIAGVYIDTSFFLSGIALGLFSAGSAYLAFYLYKVMLPIAVLAIILLFLLVYFKRARSQHH
jgi:hypothetical protein